ncbi:hypothetical protein HPB49_015685 [Dermacentor silvarum]|uniref:Uncharacterized protein n=1 Tax=Dermacentor silvarum TaxID=543639 RepID=A0ACB8E1C6_DERSI|nr:hypothetical protein HPB49_015685 [Dermacentor silvarum]
MYIYQHGELGAAFAAYLSTQAAASLSLLPTWEQNLIVAGTRDPHVADKLLREFQLDSSIGQLLMHAHLKLTGEVCRGVITVANHETSESLQKKIQFRAGELADIRKLGNSNVAAFIFVGKVVPRFVHYNSEATHVLAYERTIPACGRCGTVGHRAGTCPCPDNEKCGLCGHTVPTPNGSVGKPMQPTPVTARESSANSSCPATRPNALSPEQPGDLRSHQVFRLQKPMAERDLVAHGSDPKTLSPPPLSVTSVHGKKTAPPPPPPSGKNTCHFPALKTDGAASARASTPKHGKQNSDATESDAKLSPALVATISAMEDRLTSKLGSMNETAMDQILTKVMTSVPAMISKHIMDSPRLLRWLGPVKDVSCPSKFNCLINESDNEDNCPAHFVITPLVAQRAGSGAATPSSSPLQNFNHG